MNRSDYTDIMEVWAEYKLRPTKELRNSLVEEYLPLVKYIAERIYARLPKAVELGDLVNDGFFGLLSAIEAFDLSRGFKFPTFCSRRIRGAILDGLRSMDWIPRLTRSRSQKLENARFNIALDKGRKATNEEVAERLGLSDKDYFTFARKAMPVPVTSLHRLFYDNNAGKDVLEEELIDSGVPEPWEIVAEKDWWENALCRLPRDQKLSFELYYHKGITMKETGRTVGLTESRISQILARGRTLLLSTTLREAWQWT